MFVASPSTMRTVWPACSASDASSVASLASASASRSTWRRNACGVCARKMVRAIERRAHDETVTTCLTVSRAATAASAAPDSAAAAMVLRDQIGARERPGRRRERRSRRFAPGRRGTPPPPNPAAARRRRRHAAAWQCRSGSAGGAPASPPAARRRRRPRPACVRNAPNAAFEDRLSGDRQELLGLPAPSRSPRPPAAMIAVTYILGIIEGSGSRFTVQRFKVRVLA